MPGKTFGIKMHGPTEAALSAQFVILKQDDLYSLGSDLIDGTEPILVDRLKDFLKQTIDELNQRGGESK